MTTFADGPAKGQCLILHRAAQFLRVTESNGKFDALDQLGDTPRPEEKLYAYQITGQPAMCHIRASRGGGFYAIATYRFVANQPSDGEMRVAGAWHDWCAKNSPQNKQVTT